MSLGAALVLTISDSASPASARTFPARKRSAFSRRPVSTCAAIEVLPDERAAIESRLRRACDEGFGLVVTTGGTGLSPRDVTPEATLAVIDRQCSGHCGTDAAGRPEEHAPGGSFPGGFGNSGVDSDNQLARKRQRRERMSGGSSARFWLMRSRR